MKGGTFSEFVRKLVDGLGCGFVDEAVTGRSAAIDLATLKVAMAIAALDGDVSEGELAEFEKLVATCSIPEGAARDKAFEDCLRFAGYIDLQARRLEKGKLLELFAAEVMEVLPPKFFRGDMAHVRRAFATWVAIAMSDNYFSGIERQAIGLLREKIAGSVAAVDKAAIPMAVSSLTVMSGGGTPSVLGTREPPTADFIRKVEGAVSRLKHEETSEQAAKDLEDLIANS